MMQIIPKWKIAYDYADGRHHEVWVSDSFASNILRKAADLDFSETGLSQPVRVLVEQCGPAPTNVSVSVTTSAAVRP